MSNAQIKVRLPPDVRRYDLTEDEPATRLKIRALNLWSGNKLVEDARSLRRMAKTMARSTRARIEFERREINRCKDDDELRKLFKKRPPVSADTLSKICAALLSADDMRRRAIDFFRAAGDVAALEKTIEQLKQDAEDQARIREDEEKERKEKGPEAQVVETKIVSAPDEETMSPRHAIVMEMAKARGVARRVPPPE